jgi:hypothetical protein
MTDLVLPTGTLVVAVLLRPRCFGLVFRLLGFTILAGLRKYEETLVENGDCECDCDDCEKLYIESGVGNVQPGLKSIMTDTCCRVEVRGIVGDGDGFIRRWAQTRRGKGKTDEIGFQTCTKPDDSNRARVDRANAVGRI